MLSVFSQDVIPGEMVAIWRKKKKNMSFRFISYLLTCGRDVITWPKTVYEDRGLTMHVREFSPIKESLRTWVSLLALNGVWGLLRPRALIHS